MESGRKLLMVGFERATKGCVDESLAPLGHRLVTVGSGAAALRLTFRRRYDALLVSHPMAGAPTSGFLHAVRNPESPCRTSGLVLLTTEKWRREAESYVGRGANRVLAMEEVPEALPEVLRPLFQVAPRFAMRIPSRIEVIGQAFPRRVICETVNISTTGMLLRVPHSVPPPTELRFELFMPGLEHAIRGEIRVVRQTCQGREPYPGIAVTFCGFEGGGGELLALHLGKHGGASAGSPS